MSRSRTAPLSLRRRPQRYNAFFGRNLAPLNRSTLGGMFMHAFAARATLMGMLLLRQLGFSPHVAPEPIEHDLVQLWVDPIDLEERDLFVGPNLNVDPPDTSQAFTFVDQKTSGFSPGY